MPIDSPSEDQICCPGCSRLIGIEEHERRCPEIKHYWPAAAECGCARPGAQSLQREEATRAGYHLIA
jgi:hypothetical protein